MAFRPFSFYVSCKERNETPQYHVHKWFPPLCNLGQI
uniref:Uncharacterized protein n=1 Tax=Anguilla anguilla TaxID=7936 RepID=A0A0E9WH47_ANGAN